jgi:hypothetical protein
MLKAGLLPPNRACSSSGHCLQCVLSPICLAPTSLDLYFICRSVVLTIRTYALYEKSKRILALILTIALSLFGIACVRIPRSMICNSLSDAPIAVSGALRPNHLQLPPFSLSVGATGRQTRGQPCGSRLLGRHFSRWIRSSLPLPSGVRGSSAGNEDIDAPGAEGAAEWARGGRRWTLCAW